MQNFNTRAAGFSLYALPTFAPMANQVFDRVEALIAEITAATAEGPEAVEQFRIRYLGSKNVLKPLMAEMRNLEPADRKAYGQLVNRAKQTAQDKYDALNAASAQEAESSAAALGADAGAEGENKNE